MTNNKMKKLFFVMMTGLIMIACTEKNDNPFFQEFNTPYGAPPFEQIENRHFLPAFREGIKQQQAEIDAIANNSEVPTFENTIAALDYSGVLLNSVSSVFFNVNGTDTDDERRAIALEVSPLLSEHADNIYMNDNLFQRVQTLYNQRATLGLNAEQNRLLENYHRNFIRAGAALSDADKARMREINSALSTLQLTFSQNVLAEINAFQHFVTDESELAGLSEGVRQAAKESAAAAGREGAWLFTIQKSSFLPVLQYGENRDLRRILFTAFSKQGNNNNENDNKDIIKQIVSLRVERAQILGFESPSHFILEDRMAKNPETVMEFLDELWVPISAKVRVEAAELQAMLSQDLPGETLKPWDWWYYTEKLRLARYDLDEEELRAYFKMENVRQGSFDVASKLFGIKFEKMENMPIYHPDVEVFRVTNTDGSFIGILYTDYFPRAGKRPGAWMSSFRSQFKKDGVNIHPIITNVGNFTPPTAERPSLLTMSEVGTLYHELGHALHGLLSNVTYPSLAGTNTPIDFVELPSQIMEHWAFQPEVMKMYAFHYQTGEVISDELIERIQRSSTFNQGFEMTERLSTSYLDMAFHMRNTTEPIADVIAFERAELDRINLVPYIIPRWPSTYFNHAFSLMYASAYYSYTWSAVLDADAFEAFVETGNIFDKETGMRFRREILERGGSEDAMTMYINFRGREPISEPLMRNLGLK
jgi:peptidyl-dipeptidase Dcp